MEESRKKRNIEGWKKVLKYRLTEIQKDRIVLNYRITEIQKDIKGG